MTRACQGCGAPLDYTGRGRPRAYCGPACKPRARKPASIPGRRVFLYAFEMYTHAHDDDERMALRAIMARAAADAGITLHPERGDATGIRTVPR